MGCDSGVKSAIVRGVDRVAGAARLVCICHSRRAEPWRWCRASGWSSRRTRSWW